jgi:hypothetical protein
MIRHSSIALWGVGDCHMGSALTRIQWLRKWLAQESRTLTKRD